MPFPVNIRSGSWSLLFFLLELKYEISPKAIFEPDSSQEMRPEEHLLAAASLLQKKEDTIANLQFEVNQLKRKFLKVGGKDLFHLTCN
jgi:hypothetical protein